MTEKDYSLLRPFDLEAAKAGAKVCWHEDGEVAVDVMFVRDRVIPLFEMCFSKDRAAVFTHDDSRRYLRAAPLCWVEGKPVYPGDGLWWILQDKWIVARGYYEHLDVIISVDSNDVASLRKLTWAKPVPIKRWINVYPATGYDTKAAADQIAAIGRIACIEIELPPLKP